MGEVCIQLNRFIPSSKRTCILLLYIILPSLIKIGQELFEIQLKFTQRHRHIHTDENNYLFKKKFLGQVIRTELFILAIKTQKNIEIKGIKILRLFLLWCKLIFDSRTNLFDLTTKDPEKLRTLIIMLQSSAIDVLAQISAIVSVYHTMAEL